MQDEVMATALMNTLKSADELAAVLVAREADADQSTVPASASTSNKRYKHL
jgi:hypothetical protein